MNPTQLRRDVRRFFRSYAGARVRLPSTSGNQYELFVYVLVCNAVQQAGFSLQLQGPSGRYFLFRNSPGAPGNSFNYFSFVGQSGDDYQIRNGIEIQGHSGMAHEADILILRTNSPNSRPSATHDELVLAVECKCYSAASRLKSEVRKNVGTVQDWSAQSHGSNVSGRPQGCIHCGLGFTPAFATNVLAGQRGDIETYLDAYDLGPHFGIRPGTPETAAFQNMISNAVQSL